MLKNVFEKYFHLKDEYFVSITAILFYLILWIFNPGNKLIVASYIPLFFLLNFKLKNFKFSLLTTYLISMIIFTGKTYYYQLIKEGIFPIELYPQGYVIPFIISAKNIISALMFVTIIRDFFLRKINNYRFNFLDSVVISFFKLQIFSDFIASKMPEISLLFSVQSLEYLILYFFIKLYKENFPNIYKVVFWLFISILVFQSTISIQQFVAGSPVFKNLEHSKDIIYFGWASDELQFRFRPVGTFPHANILAVWLGYLLLSIGVELLANFNYLFFGVFLFGLVCLVTTLSRSAWLGFSTGILSTLYIFEKVKHLKLPKILYSHYKMLIMLCAFLIIFFIFPRIDKSIYSFVKNEGGGYLRQAQTKETLNLIFEFPLFGTGSFMSVQEAILANPTGIYSQAPNSMHNWYLLLAVEHGIPVLILFLIFVVISLKRILKGVLADKRFSLENNLKFGSLGAILFLLVAVFFQNFFVYGPFMISLALYNDDK
jgi:hypothetical protein